MKGKLLKGATIIVEEKKAEAAKFLDPATHSFPYEALKGSFPEGVDPTMKEAYLSDGDFQKVFSLSKSGFY